MRRIWLVVVTAALLCGCSNSGSLSGPSPVKPTDSATPPAAVTSYDAAQPVGMVVAAGKVWTVEAGGDEITGRSSPSADPVRVHVGATPLRAVYDGQLLWVTVFGAERVVAVDPRRARVVHRLRVAGQPEGIVSAFGSIWVVRQQARRLTPLTPTGLGRSYHLGDEPRLVVADRHYLFVSNFGDGTVTRVQPHSDAVKTSRRLCTGPQGMVATRGVLWVACTPDDAVIAVDIRTLRPLGKVEVSGEPDAIRLVGSTVFVVTTAGPTLVEISGEATDPEIVRRTALGEAIPLGDRANVDAVHTKAHWWVSSPGENRVAVYPK